MDYNKYAEILDRCYTAVLMDVMDIMNVRVQCMEPAIKPLLPSMRCWGASVTLFFDEVSTVPEHPYALEMEVIDDLLPGDVIVCQCNTTSFTAIWGGLLSNAAIGRNASGVIVDGGSRDYHEIVSLGFPTFCKGLTPYDSLGRIDAVARDIPVVCGGIDVCPGDLIYGDADGVVVVPKDIAPEVIARAGEKVSGEQTVREELRGGASVVETFKKYGIL